MNLSDLSGLPFLRDAKFWFALFNVLVIFAQRFGVTLTAQEIASVNLVIAVIFGISPPTIQYMRGLRAEHKP